MLRRQRTLWMQLHTKSSSKSNTKFLWRIAEEVSFEHIKGASSSNITIEMKYFPHTQQDIEQMLQVAGLKSLDDLFAEIPEQLQFNREFALPEAMSEVKILEGFLR